MDYWLNFGLGILKNYYFTAPMSFRILAYFNTNSDGDGLLPWTKFILLFMIFFLNSGPNLGTIYNQAAQMGNSAYNRRPSKFWHVFGVFESAIHVVVLKRDWKITWRGPVLTSCTSRTTMRVLLLSPLMSGSGNRTTALRIGWVLYHLIFFTI